MYGTTYVADDNLQEQANIDILLIAHKIAQQVPDQKLFSAIRDNSVIKLYPELLKIVPPKIKNDLSEQVKSQLFEEDSVLVLLLSYKALKIQSYAQTCKVQ